MKPLIYVGPMFKLIARIVAATEVVGKMESTLLGDNGVESELTTDSLDRLVEAAQTLIEGQRSVANSAKVTQSVLNRVERTLDNGVAKAKRVVNELEQRSGIDDQRVRALRELVNSLSNTSDTRDPDPDFPSPREAA